MRPLRNYESNAMGSRSAVVGSTTHAFESTGPPKRLVKYVTPIRLAALIDVNLTTTEFSDDEVSKLIASIKVPSNVKCRAS